jgi:Leucine-rich repeat (LRR) protein
MDDTSLLDVLWIVIPLLSIQETVQLGRLCVRYCEYVRTQLVERLELDCRGIKFSSDLACISFMSHVKILDLSFCSENLYSLYGIPTTVEWLNIACCEFLEDVSELESLTSLVHLDMSCMKESNHPDDVVDESWMQEEFLEHLSGLTSLQHLNLDGCMKITNSGLLHLSGLTSMLHLNLEFCAEITDISALSALRALQHLNLEYVADLDDIGSMQLSCLTSLTYLSLHATSVGNMCTANMSTLTSLRSLDMEACSVTSYPCFDYMPHLTQLRLDDNKCPIVISALRSLMELHAWDCHLTQLVGISRLTTLTWLQCIATDEEVQQLSAQLPNCKIHQTEL